MNERNQGQRPVNATYSRPAGTRPMAEGKRPMNRQSASQANRRPAPTTNTPSAPMPTVVLGGVPIEAQEKKKRSLLAPAENAPRVRTIHAKKKSPFPISTVFTLLLCTGLFMYLIHNFVQINEYNLKLDDMQGELSELVGMQQNLELQLENRNDMNTISEIAEDKLGMVKMDEVEKIYLDGSAEDKIEISKNVEDEEATQVSPLSLLLSALFRNFRDFAEYID